MPDERGGSDGPRRVLWVIVLVLAPLPLTIWIAGIALFSSHAPDWEIFVEAGQRAWSGGDIFASDAFYHFRYSPIVAYMMPSLAWIGIGAWRALHLAAAAALPSWPLRLLALGSFAFWEDLQGGNVLMFVGLMAVYAVRGSHIASCGFLLCAILIPRPLMVPLAAWLLWRHPKLRLPFAIALSTHVLFLVGSGWAEAWLTVLFESVAEAHSPLNLSPTHFVGLAWLAIGIPMAVHLARHGRLGLAGLALSPYIQPYNMLIGLVDFDGQVTAGRRRDICLGSRAARTAPTTKTLMVLPEKSTGDRRRH